MWKEYKIEVEANRVTIAYREVVRGRSREVHEFVKTIEGKEQRVVLEVEVRPTEEGEEGGVKVATSRAAKESVAKLWRPEQSQRLVLQGLEEGLERGPLLSCPVHGVTLLLHGAEVGRGTRESMLRAAAAEIGGRAVREAGVSLAEPVMMVEVTAPQELVGTVVQDLQRRRGKVLSPSLLPASSCTPGGPDPGLLHRR